MPKSPSAAADDRTRRRRGRHSGEPADWAMQDPLSIQALIVAVTSAGGAVRFGYTRQGDAYAVGFLGDGDPYTEFLRPTDDIQRWLVETTAAWNGEAPA